MCDHQLSRLSISQLSDVLASQGLHRLKTILAENEISGAMLSELESAEELQSIDGRIKPFEAKGWFKEISNLKTRLSSAKKISFECPICYRLYSEVDPTTLTCGHTICIEDARDIMQCPMCFKNIPEGFEYAVNYSIRNFAIEELQHSSKSLTKASDVPSNEGTGHGIPRNPSTVSGDATDVAKTKKLKKKKTLASVDNNDAEVVLENTKAATAMESPKSSTNEVVDNTASNHVEVVENATSTSDVSAVGAEMIVVSNDSGALQAKSSKKSNKKKSKKTAAAAAGSSEIALDEWTRQLDEALDETKHEQSVPSRRFSFDESTVIESIPGDDIAAMYEQSIHCLNEEALAVLTRIADHEEETANFVLVVPVLLAKGFLFIRNAQVDEKLEMTDQDRITLRQLNRLGNMDNKYASFLLAMWFKLYSLADPRQVFHLLNESLDFGFTYANIERAVCFTEGYGTVRDLANAELILKSCAEQHPAAFYALGMLHAHKTDRSVAIKYWRKAASAGVVQAQKQLGLVLAPHEALHFLKLACKNERDSECRLQLANLSQNEADKIKWLIEAAVRDNESATELLDVHYQQMKRKCMFNGSWAATKAEFLQQFISSGLEFEQAGKHWLAYGYFRLGGDLEIPEANYKLGEYLEYGKGVCIDLAEARRCYSLAVLKGHAKATASLGRMYELGKGVPVDMKRALDLYQKAKDKGDEEAVALIEAMKVSEA